MKNKEIQLYLILLEQYLSNRDVYDYAIESMITFDGGICFSIAEFSPSYINEKPYLLILKITSYNDLIVLNSYGKNCIYDYLEELGMTQVDADREMLFYKEMICNFQKE